jgi:hypothetical protein
MEEDKGYEYDIFYVLVKCIVNRLKILSGIGFHVIKCFVCCVYNSMEVLDYMYLILIISRTTHISRLTIPFFNCESHPTSKSYGDMFEIDKGIGTLC